MRRHSSSTFLGIARIVIPLIGVILLVCALSADWLLPGSSPGFGLRQSLLILVALGLLSAGLILRAHSVPRPLVKLSFLVLSTIVTILLVETTFRSIGYDFDRTVATFESMPIYYRQPTIPVGSVFYRRPGPAVWEGKVLSVSVELNGGSDEWYRDEEEVTITYDREGFRNPGTLSDWHIVIAGDSFVELGYLPYEDLFTTRLGQMLEVDVKNLGASHTGPLTHVFYLQEYGVSPSTRHAILVFFEGNDLGDLARVEERLRKLERTGKREYREFETQTSFLRALHSRLTRRRERKTFYNAYVRSDGKEVPVLVGYVPPTAEQLTARQRELLESSFAGWARTARKLGMTPWLVYMPTKRRVLHGHLRFTEDVEQGLVDWEPTDLPEFVEGLCETTGMGFIDLTPALVAETRKGKLTYNHVWDGHLNRHGSRIVARAMADALGPHLGDDRAAADTNLAR